LGRFFCIFGHLKKILNIFFFIFWIFELFFIDFETFWLRIRLNFSVLRPFSYLRPLLYFDLNFTSTFFVQSLLRPLDFDLYFSTNNKSRFGKSSKRSKYRKGRPWYFVFFSILLSLFQIS